MEPRVWEATGNFCFLLGCVEISFHHLGSAVMRLQPRSCCAAAAAAAAFQPDCSSEGKIWASGGPGETRARDVCLCGGGGGGGGGRCGPRQAGVLGRSAWPCQRSTIIRRRGLSGGRHPVSLGSV